MDKSEKPARGALPVKADLSIKTEIKPEVWSVLSNFFVRVAGPVQEGAEFLSDKIRYFRFRSAMRVLEEAKRIVEESGIDPKIVPTKFLVPFMESCSLEDSDSSLVEQWAKLLVSATEEYSDRHATFVNILSQISANDVRLLKAVWKRHRGLNLSKLESLLEVYAVATEQRTISGKSIVSFDLHNTGARFLISGGSAIPGYLNLEDEDNDDTVRNIESLLILERQNLVKIKAERGVHAQRENEVYVVSAALNPLGYDFVMACERPKSSE